MQLSLIDLLYLQLCTDFICTTSHSGLSGSPLKDAPAKCLPQWLSLTMEEGSTIQCLSYSSWHWSQKHMAEAAKFWGLLRVESDPLLEVHLHNLWTAFFLGTKNFLRPFPFRSYRLSWERSSSEGTSSFLPFDISAFPYLFSAQAFTPTMKSLMLFFSSKCILCISFCPAYSFIVDLHKSYLMTKVSLKNRLYWNLLCQQSSV